MKMGKNFMLVKHGINRFLFLFLVLSIILPTAVSAATGTLYITSSPSGATIQIDGVAVGGSKGDGTTPQSFPDTWEGSHTVRLTKTGYDAYSTTVTVKPGQTTSVNGKLNPTATQQPGFGALVALIGLGAVAFLVVRKH